MRATYTPTHLPHRHHEKTNTTKESGTRHVQRNAGSNVVRVSASKLNGKAVRPLSLLRLSTNCPASLSLYSQAHLGAFLILLLFSIFPFFFFFSSFLSFYIFSLSLSSPQSLIQRCRQVVVFLFTLPRSLTISSSHVRTSLPKHRFIGPGQGSH